MYTYKAIVKRRVGPSAYNFLIDLGLGVFIERVLTVDNGPYDLPYNARVTLTTTKNSLYGRYSCDIKENK